jgi:hypothetical protein
LSDQSRPASFAVPAAVALIAGVCVPVLGAVIRETADAGVMVFALPFYLSVLLFVGASLLALVLLWAARPYAKPARAGLWCLLLGGVWLGMVLFAALGEPGWSVHRSAIMLGSALMTGAFGVSASLCVRRSEGVDDA